jgi:hypothetical protein
LTIFGAEFRFDLGANACLQFGLLPASSFFARPSFLLSAQSSAFFSLFLRFCFSPAPSLFFDQPALFFFCATTRLFFGGPARLVGGETLGFVLGATTRFIFSAFAHLFFGATLCIGFCAHLRFDVGAQTCFLFRPLERFSFRLTAGFFFDATSLRFFCQHPGFFGRLYARVFAQSQPQDFLFDSGDTHVRAAADFIFLSSLPRFGVEKVAFFLSANARLFRFGLANLLKFHLVRSHRGLKLCFDFGAPRLFHRVHAPEFFVDTLQFIFGHAPARFFRRTFTHFSFDAKLFLLCAFQRGLLLLLSPAR